MTDRLLHLVLGLVLLTAAPLAHGSPFRTGAIGFGSAELGVYTLTMRDGTDVTYYATPADPGKHTLIMIQGSGCQPVMVASGGHHYSSMFGLLDAVRDGRFNVVAVEKPHAPANPVRDSGTALHCPETFNSTFTLESWAAAIEAVGTEVRLQGSGTLLLFGASEGAVVAARVASRLEDRVAAVALVGLTGASQLFDFIAAAHLGQGGPAGIDAMAGELEAAVRKINAAPEGSTDFFAGHPYKRWHSFLRANPSMDLLQASARVLLVSGTEDTSVPVLSSEIAWATLVAHGRSVEFRRIHGADHGLMKPEDADMSAVSAIYGTMLDWLAGD